MGETMRSGSTDVFSGGSGERYPLVESLGSEYGSEGGLYGDMSGEEFLSS